MIDYRETTERRKEDLRRIQALGELILLLALVSLCCAVVYNAASAWGWMV